MSWKKMIMGEKMPDKDDPKYRDRYEREVDAGRKFARATLPEQQRLTKPLPKSSSLPMTTRSSS